MKAEQLKKSILQLAISGKLTKQSSFDEPASILLQKIKAAKQELIKQGKLKKEKALPPITDEEKPFDIPENWEWVRYCDVAYLHTGNSINAEEKRKKFAGNKAGYNYIATKDVKFNNTIDYENGIKIPFNLSFEVAKENAALLCIEGGSAGRKVALLNQEVCFGNKLCAFESIEINSLYLYYSLQSSTFIENFKTNKTGMIGGVGINQLKILLFPLPPLAEQQRIVDKIERILPLIDKYDLYEKELSELEDNLQENLKKSILQYAIQGKLVSQTSSDEPASILLEKIYAEKQELIKKGKIKKEKPLLPIADGEKPFDIPASWQWARLNETFLINPTNVGLENSLEVSFVPMRLLDGGYGNSYQYETKKWVDIKSGFTHFANQDICFAKITPCFQNRKSAIFNDLKNDYGAGTTELNILRSLKDTIFSKYTLYFVKSDYFIDYGKSNFTGTAGQQRFGTSALKKCLFPLPPLAEQQRIVAKIEELFAIVDNMFNNKQKPTATVIAFPQPKQETKKPTIAIAAQGDDKGMNELLED